MAIPTLCPEFEYDGHPRAALTLREGLKDFFSSVKDWQEHEKLTCAKDTREWHNRFFAKLTPRRFEYYAGHYRGEDFFCLANYAVQVATDPMVGVRPSDVMFLMNSLSDQVQRVAALLDIEVHRHCNPSRSSVCLVKLIQGIAHLFVAFLTIHPYANGNGHMARMLIVLLLHRYGIRAPTFSIDPRPRDPLYSEAIYKYRRRDTQPLEMLLLRSLA